MKIGFDRRRKKVMEEKMSIESRRTLKRKMWRVCTEVMN
jgi:hypothetical protein